MCIFILKNYHTTNDYVKFNYIYYKYMLVAFSLKYSKIPSVEEDQTINYQENVDNIT